MNDTSRSPSFFWHAHLEPAPTVAVGVNEGADERIVNSDVQLDGGPGSRALRHPIEATVPDQPIPQLHFGGSER